MRTSNTSMRLLALLAACAAGHAAADNLTLAGGEARLSGTVRSINAQGAVELASELSPEPLLLKSRSVEKIEFNNKTPAGEPPPTLVELSNGDLLPAVIESLKEDKLAVVSPVAGRLEIPRHRVISLQPGIQRREVIYQGPHSLEEWSDGGGDMKNLIFERDALVFKGSAVASKKLPLSRQFILRFTFVWKQGMYPNFQIYFADPFLAMGMPCNRYCLDLDGGRFVFKTSFQEKPVEVPEADVSTVFLSDGASKATDDKLPPFVLRLPGEGSLGVSSCGFTGDSASVVHPLLGPLIFRRDGILSIERSPSAAGASPKP